MNDYCTQVLFLLRRQNILLIQVFFPQFTPCVHLLKIKHKSTVELVLFDQGNLGTESGHPMHLHGHSFAVVAQGRL